ncbi:MAG: hypothetical protein ACJ762_15515 [Solirubrobacteraceae bacterium]
MRNLAIATLLVLCCASSASAAENGPSFALKALGASEKGYFVFDGTPGGTVEGTLLIVNAGQKAGTARLDVVDATTGATSGAVYETVGEPSDDVGAWLRLDRSEVTLGPGESARVGFTASVPADARRGEHLGGIVAAPVATAAGADQADGDNRSFKVSVVNQSIVAVQVNLPGPARQVLKVRDVRAGGQPGYQTLVLALSNPGERMVRGTGSVEVLRGDEVVSRQRFSIDTFLPRTRIDYPLVVRGKALLPGDYRARVTLDWGTGVEHAELPFALSRKNIEQAFGSEGLAKLPDGAGEKGGSSLLLPIIAAVLALLLGVGASLLYFRRHTRRLEDRLLAQHAVVAEPVPAQEEPRFVSGERVERRQAERRGSPRS